MEPRLYIHTDRQTDRRTDWRTEWQADGPPSQHQDCTGWRKNE